MLLHACNRMDMACRPAKGARGCEARGHAQRPALPGASAAGSRVCAAMAAHRLLEQTAPAPAQHASQNRDAAAGWSLALLVLGMFCIWHCSQNACHHKDRVSIELCHRSSCSCKQLRQAGLSKQPRTVTRKLLQTQQINCRQVNLSGSAAFSSLHALHINSNQIFLHLEHFCCMHC